jgi:DNA-binding CsgD family transcriptional regulator
MSSTIEKNKLKNDNQQSSNSGSILTRATARTGATQTLKKGQVKNNTREEEEEGAKGTKKRRPTKVGLNDTLRRIRHLMIEGRSNLEIQDILQLEERTFYRYMAKIYERDQVLFAEQEKKTMTTEFGIFKDRWLRAYRWYIAMADNENMKVDIRMEAQLNAIDMALALLDVEREGPKVIEQGGRKLLEKLYHNSQ